MTIEDQLRTIIGQIDNDAVKDVALMTDIAAAIGDYVRAREEFRSRVLDVMARYGQPYVPAPAAQKLAGGYSPPAQPYPYQDPLATVPPYDPLVDLATPQGAPLTVTTPYRARS